MRRFDDFVRLGIRAALAAAMVSAPGPQADAGEGAPEPTSRLEIRIEGPDGPVPQGHAEIVVTIHETALADAPPETARLATAREVVGVLVLPHTMAVDVPARLLEKSPRPAAAAVIAIARRPAYWSETSAPVERHGVTVVRVAGPR